jgi:hypothetical protein
MKSTLSIYYLGILFIIGQISPVSAQTSQELQNLQKYWRTRERLSNFVVPGDCQGCSLLSTSRENQAKEPGYNTLSYNGATIVSSGDMGYPDAIIHLGFYIGTLAMEYDLLRQHGETAKAEKALRELAYALEAVNRLDKMAEVYWRSYFDGAPIGTGHPPTPDLNGFFIRDDVPADFVDGFVDRGSGNRLIENELNSSYFPAEDFRIAEVMKSAFTTDIYRQGDWFTAACLGLNGDHLGPQEESLDQVCALMMGLALAAKNVPDFAVANSESGVDIEFSDGLTNVKLEVKAIAERITSWIQIHNWNIVNPVTNSCVKGVYWDQNSPGGDACKCSDGGGLFEAFSYALGMTNARIQTSIYPSLGSDFATEAFILTRYNGDATFSTSKHGWKNIPGVPTFENVCIGAEDYKVLTLAAISQVWGATTANVLTERCAKEFITSPPFSEALAQVPGNRLHLPLLHQALYGAIWPSYPQEFYKCLLDNAPCVNTRADNGNEIWSNANGFAIYGYSREPASSEINNLDYLYYFNLFNSVHPSYLGSDYSYISPLNLCETDIVKTGTLIKDIASVETLIPAIESDRKHFIAANSITAQGGNPTNSDIIQQKRYIIENDSDPQSSTFGTADIFYEAKNEIILQPGFEVHAGAEFKAVINPALSPIACSSSSSVPVSTCDGLIPSIYRTMSSPPDTNDINEIFSRIKNGRAQQDTTLIIKERANFIDVIPNPNNGSFQIVVTQNENAGTLKEVKVFDIMGKVVWQTGTSISNIFVVDISGYAAGIYYVKTISDSGEVMVEKLIKN